MLKILIAEDDRELRQLFTHVLNRHGYTVIGVSNGQEALDAMDTDFFDLIISDIMMPVMDGYELVQQLRDVGNTTPILMITARDAFDDICVWGSSPVWMIIWSSPFMSMKWFCGYRHSFAGPK